MNTAYSYPPDKNLLREKLSSLHFSETPEAWQKFEQFWSLQKPIETPVKKQFRFVGIPLPLILRGFFASALVLISMGLYNTANSKLPPVLQEAGAGKSRQSVKPAKPVTVGHSASAAKTELSRESEKIRNKNKQLPRQAEH